MNVKKALIIAAVIVFVLAAFNAGSLPWIPIGLALFAGSFLTE